MTEKLENLIHHIGESVPEIDADRLVECITDKEYILSHVHVRLLNSKDVRLSDVIDLDPLYYKVWGETDLHISYFVDVDDGYIIPLRNTLMDIAHITPKELEDVVMEELNNNYKIDALNALVTRLLDDTTNELLVTPQDESKMAYVLYGMNDTAEYGATLAISDKILSEICAKLHKNEFYIIPSSIHEMIIFPMEYSTDNTMYIKYMIDSGNKSLKPGEILSYIPYYYNHGHIASAL